MLGPLLESLWKQIGPTAKEIFQLAAPYAKRIPPYVYARAASGLSSKVSDWYSSLSFERQEKIDGAIAWVAKDLSGDLIAKATGLPIAPLVEKVLSLAWEFKNDPGAEAYISHQLTRQLEQKSENHHIWATETQRNVLTTIIKSEKSVNRSELESLMPDTSSSSVGAALIALINDKYVSEIIDRDSTHYSTTLRLEDLES